MSLFLSGHFAAPTGHLNKQNYGLVIGISDYQDDAISDLQFAHRDAEAFANYLVNAHGYKVPLENLELIINEKATGGNVHKALGSILEKAKANDRVYIYFAGHGDVEVVDKKESGHLLLYDTPANTYQINSLRVNDLKTIVSKLTDDVGAEVILITDACHSGKLAGDAIHGTQLTNSVLANRFGNETKILSCGPDEYSQEGKQWGGGRGVFSFNLIEGLTGLADNNADSQVTGRELQRYLEDKVEQDVYPNFQTPELVGDRRQILNFVDEDALVKLLESKSSEAGYEELSAALTVVSNSPSEKVSLAKQDFYGALQEGYFIPADIDIESLPDLQSASDLYDKVLTKQLSENQLKGLKADFIAALQDDAQAAINSYLTANNEIIIDYEFDNGIAYKLYPEYLEKAAELLGPNHYLYSQMLAKKHYFKGVYYRISSLTVADKQANYKLAEEEIRKALLYDDKAAYIYMELGMIYSYMQDERSIEMYKRAISLAPNWALPYTSLAYEYQNIDKDDLAWTNVKKALSRNPKYERAHLIKAIQFRKEGKVEESKNILLNYIKEYGPSHFIYRYLGSFEFENGNTNQAIIYLESSIKTKPNFGGYFYLGNAYYQTDIAKSKEYWQKALEIFPNSEATLNNLAWLNQINKEYDLAIEKYQKAISLNTKSFLPRLNLGKIYFELEAYLESEEQFEFILNELEPRNNEVFFYLAKIACNQEDDEGCMDYLELAIKNGYDKTEEIRSNSIFNLIQEFPKFKNLIGEK